MTSFIRVNSDNASLATSSIRIETFPDVSQSGTGQNMNVVPTISTTIPTTQFVTSCPIQLLSTELCIWSSTTNHKHTNPTNSCPAAAVLSLTDEPATMIQPMLNQNQRTARQSMSRDLPSFSGRPEEWPIFVSNFERTKQVCGLSNDENAV